MTLVTLASHATSRESSDDCNALVLHRHLARDETAVPYALCVATHVPQPDGGPRRRMSKTRTHSNVIKDMLHLQRAAPTTRVIRSRFPPSRLEERHDKIQHNESGVITDAAHACSLPLAPVPRGVHAARPGAEPPSLIDIERRYPGHLRLG